VQKTMAVLVALVVLAASVQADVPTMINYQGKLSTAAGVPVNGTKMMIFQFRDLPEGGEVLAGFSEVQQVVVSRGVFNVLIGSTYRDGVPPDVFRKPQVYLSVRVDEVELLPRQRVTSVAFAYKAAQADSATTAEIADTATTSTTAQSLQTAAMQAPAVASRAMPAYISSMIGQKTGAIRGSYTYGTNTGWMVVYELDHSIVCPIDASSGLPTGSIINKPLTVVMPIDKATPVIYNALATSENLTVVEIRLMRKNAAGADEHYYTIKLENAMINSARTFIPNILDGQNGNQGQMTQISFVYRKMTLTSVLDGASCVINVPVMP
jgi:type VI secretion system secreted protein Hcp